MSANRKPNPVARAETKTKPTDRRLATRFACATKPQLTTINGMKIAERLVQLVEHGMRQQVDRRDECRQQHQVEQDADGEQHAAQQRHRGVADDEHRRRHDAERNAVDE